jgi:hypothetical protein
MVESDWTGTCTHEVYGFDSRFDYLRTAKRRINTMLD